MSIWQRLMGMRSMNRPGSSGSQGAFGQGLQQIQQQPSRYSMPMPQQMQGIDFGAIRQRANQQAQQNPMQSLDMNAVRQYGGNAFQQSMQRAPQGSWLNSVQQQYSQPQSQQWTDENRKHFMRPIAPIYQDPNLNNARQTAMDNWRTDYGVPTFKPIGEAAFGEAAGRYGATNNSVGTWPMLGQNPAPVRQPVLDQFRPSNQINNTQFSSRSGVSSAAGNGATNSMIVRALRGF